MFSNIKYPVVLLLAGFILFLCALMLRFLQWPGGSVMAWGAIILQIISIKWLMSVFFKSGYPAMLFLAAFVLFLAGLAFKIMHWPYAQVIIVVPLSVLIIAVAWLIFVVIKKGERLKQKDQSF